MMTKTKVWYKGALLALLCGVTCGSSVLRYFPMSTDTKSVQHNDWPPKFCNGLGCPKYKVLDSKKEYEYREYEGSAWVSTAQTGVDFQKAQYTMFMKLFNYISGSNAKKEKIDMTCPVVTRIIPGEGPTCSNNFTMSFFLSPPVVPAPQPTDSTVYLKENVPSFKVYVRSFSGFAEKSDWLSQAQALASALPETASYHTDFYFTAGYDSPFKFLNRHNEIWFIAK